MKITAVDVSMELFHDRVEMTFYVNKSTTKYIWLTAHVNTEDMFTLARHIESNSYNDWDQFVLGYTALITNNKKYYHPVQPRTCTVDVVKCTYPSSLMFNFTGVGGILGYGYEDNDIQILVSERLICSTLNQYVDIFIRKTTHQLASLYFDSYHRSVRGLTINATKYELLPDEKIGYMWMQFDDGIYTVKMKYPLEGIKAIANACRSNVCDNKPFEINMTEQVSSLYVCINVNGTTPIKVIDVNSQVIDVIGETGSFLNNRLTFMLSKFSLEESSSISTADLYLTGDVLSGFIQYIIQWTLFNPGREMLKHATIQFLKNDKELLDVTLVYANKIADLAEKISNNEYQIYADAASALDDIMSEYIKKTQQDLLKKEHVLSQWILSHKMDLLKKGTSDKKVNTELRDRPGDTTGTCITSSMIKSRVNIHPKNTKLVFVSGANKPDHDVIITDGTLVRYEENTLMIVGMFDGANSEPVPIALTIKFTSNSPHYEQFSIGEIVMTIVTCKISLATNLHEYTLPCDTELTIAVTKDVLVIANCDIDLPMISIPGETDLYHKVIMEFNSFGINLKI